MERSPSSLVLDNSRVRVSVMVGRQRFFLHVRVQSWCWANRSRASLEETRDLLRKEGYDAECVMADINNEADCAALVDATNSKFGRIDILHNNVGIGALDGDTVKIEKSAWENVFNVN